MAGPGGLGASKGHQCQFPYANAAPNRWLSVHRFVLRYDLFHGRPPAKRGRGYVRHRHHPPRFGDDSLSAAVHQGANRPILQKSAWAPDAHRTYDFRARVRADREHRWALSGAGDQNRAGVDRSGPDPAGHYRRKSGQ